MTNQRARAAARGVLVTGTDTGVGKTVTSVLLISSLVRRGVPVAAMKPVETGVVGDAPLDALAIAAACSSSAPLDDVCPYRFGLPVAPEAAAAAEGMAIDPAVIRAAFGRLATGGRFVVVEGAGGAGTPYGPSMLCMDLAGILGIPAVVVARATLGTVGQTVVTLRALRASGVRCCGVILCRQPGLPPGPDDATNASLIEAHSDGVPVLFTVPVIPGLAGCR